MSFSVKWIDTYLTKLISLQEFSLIVIGCGYGQFLKYLNNLSNFNEVIGIDINSNVITIAQEHFPHLRFIKSGVEGILKIQKNDKLIIVVKGTLQYFTLSEITCLLKSLKKIKTCYLILREPSSEENDKSNISKKKRQWILQS